MSSMEVGLIIASVSHNTFDVKLANSFGELKKDDTSFLYFSGIDGEELENAIRFRACQSLGDALHGSLYHRGSFLFYMKIAKIVKYLPKK